MAILILGFWVIFSTEVLAADKINPVQANTVLQDLPLKTTSKLTKFDYKLIDRDFFDHNVTSFALRGSHALQMCDACHKPNESYNKAERACLSCHESEQKQHQSLGLQCENCHLETFWSQVRFNHVNTGYRLEGAHQHTACTQCHVNSQYKSASKVCKNCHELDNVHFGFSRSPCAKCHTPNSWAVNSFNHALQTGFALKGRHQSVSCDFCHAGRNVRKTESACRFCHASEDVHQSIFQDDCGICHTSKSWKKKSFSHQAVSTFELTGKHKKLACLICHQSPENKKMSDQCVSCHSKDDVHLSQLGNSCEDCHKANTWLSEIHFDHDLTSFPLLGIHSIISCERCHLNRSFKNTKSRCQDCHASLYLRSHAGKLGDTCESCHSPVDWNYPIFIHTMAEFTKFDKQHFFKKCRDCHQDGNSVWVKNIKKCSQCHNEKEYRLRQ